MIILGKKLAPYNSQGTLPLISKYGQGLDYHGVTIKELKNTNLSNLPNSIVSLRVIVFKLEAPEPLCHFIYLPHMHAACGSHTK